jgi:methyl-accepting chemotaxis protein
VVVDGRGFVQRLETVKGKPFSQDELESLKKVFAGTRDKLMAARAEFGKKGAAATGLSESDVTGALPRPGEDLSRVDNALAEKAEKQGKPLTAEAKTKVRAALKEYSKSLEAIREAMVQEVATVVKMRPGQVEEQLPPKGFPAMVFRGGGGPDDEGPEPQ